MFRVNWKIPPSFEYPKEGELHIWRLNVDAVEPDIGRAVLSDEECQRADRFVFDADRRRFIVARAMLRFLLSHYLDIEPEDIEFTTNEYGKPFLPDTYRTPIQFNISHSAHVAVFGFSRKQVGIDIELQKPEFASLDIAQRFFSKQEVLDLQAAAPHDFVSCFFDCWSRKESYIKAKGMGVSLPLESFTTRAISPHVAQLVWSSHFPRDPHDYVMIPFTPFQQCSGAVTAQAPIDTVSAWDGQVFYQTYHNITEKSSYG